MKKESSQILNLAYALVVLSALVLSACSKSSTEMSSPPPQSTVGAPATQSTIGQASVEGVVTFTGPSPKEVKNPATGSSDCLAKAADENQKVVRVYGGKLMNAFVYVQAGLPKGVSYPAPKDDVILDQQSCAYVPRVVGAMVNQSIQIINSDFTLHNVHAMPKESSAFNLGMPMKGMKIAKSFPKSEVMVPVKCDVHNWMRAYVGVLDHPYFSVSNHEGVFLIKGLPAGTYTLAAWHEKLGVKTQTITVGAQETKKITFAF